MMDVTVVLIRMVRLSGTEAAFKDHGSVQKARRDMLEASVIVS